MTIFATAANNAGATFVNMGTFTLQENANFNNLGTFQNVCGTLHISGTFSGNAVVNTTPCSASSSSSSTLTSTTAEFPAWLLPGVLAFVLAVAFISLGRRSVPKT